MDNTKKHTPSPWATRGWSVTGPTAAADYVAAEAVKAALPEVFVRTVGQAWQVGKAAVCTVYGMSAEEVEANARLIAAAPDLAAALKACVDFYGYAEFGPIADARAALAAVGAE